MESRDSPGDTQRSSQPDLVGHCPPGLQRREAEMDKKQFGWKKVCYLCTSTEVKEALSRSRDLIAGANGAPLRAGPASFTGGNGLTP